MKVISVQHQIMADAVAHCVYHWFKPSAEVHGRSKPQCMVAALDQALSGAAWEHDLRRCTRQPAN